MSSVPSSYLSLTARQRVYVDSRLQGLSKKASAAAAGSTRYESYEGVDKVREALVDMIAKGAEEVGFTRKEAHQMYMEAYQNAETATEQIAAVNAMVKLHGLEAPKKVEVEHQHTHTGQIEHMPTEELMKLANMRDTLTLEGEFEQVEEKPVLEAPEVTEDNSIDSPELQNVSDGYRA